MEVYKYFNYGSSHTYGINMYIYEDVTGENLEELIGYCGRDNVRYWNPIHNCALVASNAWNLISTTQVTAKYISILDPAVTSLISTPKGLYKNLETINGSAKNYPFASQFQ